MLNVTFSVLYSNQALFVNGVFPAGESSPRVFLMKKRKKQRSDSLFFIRIKAFFVPRTVAKKARYLLVEKISIVAVVPFPISLKR